MVKSTVTRLNSTASLARCQSHHASPSGQKGDWGGGPATDRPGNCRGRKNGLVWPAANGARLAGIRQNGRPGDPITKLATRGKGSRQAGAKLELRQAMARLTMGGWTGQRSYSLQRVGKEEWTGRATHGSRNRTASHRQIARIRGARRREVMPSTERSIGGAGDGERLTMTHASLLGRGRRIHMGTAFFCPPLLLALDAVHHERQQTTFGARPM